MMLWMLQTRLGLFKVMAGFAKDSFCLDVSIFMVITIVETF
jgi:hypothetical protein